MKNIFFICICALFAFTGCTDDDDELLANGTLTLTCFLILNRMA